MHPLSVYPFVLCVHGHNDKERNKSLKHWLIRSMLFSFFKAVQRQLCPLDLFLFNLEFRIIDMVIHLVTGKKKF